MSRLPFDDYYILDDDNGLVYEPDGNRAYAWRRAHQESRCRVGRTYLGDGAVEISTVFLGINPNAGSGLPPNPFETMVRRGEVWAESRRWHSWQEALEGHEAMVRYVATGDRSALDALRREALREQGRWLRPGADI